MISKLERIIFSILVLVSVGFISAQNFENYIYGRVVDDETGESLPNVNVYISGTTWGTATDNNGYFKIRSIYPAEHEVVFSLIGFEVSKKSIVMGKISKLDLKVIRLKPKAYEIDELEVVAEKPDEWIDDLKFFKNMFLGSSLFAMDCEISNEMFLEFEKPDKNIFLARCDRPLKIVNKALGFEIECQLVNFKYDESESRLQYMTTTLFKEMKPLDEVVEKRWNENRIIAYENSLEYFLTKFITNEFINLGFKVLISRIPLRHGMDGYRQKIFSSDSLVAKDGSSGEFRLKFPYYLQVTGKGKNNEIDPISWIRILGSEAVIDEFGYSKNIIAFETHGHWSHLGMANLLPKYYFAVSDKQKNN